MPAPVTIRNAASSDAADLLEIYRPYVETNATSFELQLPTAAEFGERIDAALEKWAWLVAEIEGSPVGYAYGSGHRARPAYIYSVETSVYVDSTYHRGGVARTLYRELFGQLRAREFESAYAGITLPNDPSVRLHESLGFRSIGVFPRVGYKFGRWHDVAWLYRPVPDRDAATGS